MSEYPRPRELCGAYYRAERDGKWQNVCFSDMTPEEMDSTLARMNYETTRGLLEIEVGAAHNLVEFLESEGWECPELDISWAREPVINFLTGGINELREKCKLVALLMHAIGDMSGTTTREPEEDGDE